MTGGGLGRGGVSIELPPKCPRSRGDCQPLAQVLSDDETTFVCVGENDGSSRTWHGDRFRHCVKSTAPGPDSMQDCDERDMADQASVLVQAISIVANKRAPAEATQSAVSWSVTDRRREHNCTPIIGAGPDDGGES